MADKEVEDIVAWLNWSAELPERPPRAPETAMTNMLQAAARNPALSVTEYDQSEMFPLVLEVEGETPAEGDEQA